MYYFSTSRYNSQTSGGICSKLESYEEPSKRDLSVYKHAKDVEALKSFNQELRLGVKGVSGLIPTGI